MKNLPEILKVEGVDVFFVGAGDLAQTMGYPGNRNAPEVQKVVREACDIIVSAGKVAGLSCDEEKMTEFAGWGVQYFHTAMTPLIQYAARHFWNLLGEKRC